jgi:hypothetical protein
MLIIFEKFLAPAGVVTSRFVSNQTNKYEYAKD